MNANKISLNAEDVLSRQKLKVNGKRLYPSSYIKCLGIYLDEHLNWKKYINILSSKFRRANGVLAELRHFIPKKAHYLPYIMQYLIHI